MKTEEKTIKLAEFLGVKPVLEEWWAHKEDNSGGSICMRADSEREVQEWIDKQPEGSWAKDYKPKPFYRYPEYYEKFDVIHGAIARQDWDEATQRCFVANLCFVFGGEVVQAVCHATPAHYADALGVTVGAWSFDDLSDDHLREPTKLIQPQKLELQPLIKVLKQADEAMSTCRDHMKGDHVVQQSYNSKLMGDATFAVRSALRLGSNPTLELEISCPPVPPKLRRDWIGAKVKLLRKFVLHSKIVPEGTICFVEFAHCGADLTTDPCPSCGVQVRIHKASWVDLEYLGKGGAE